MYGDQTRTTGVCRSPHNPPDCVEESLMLSVPHNFLLDHRYDLFCAASEFSQMPASMLYLQTGCSMSLSP